MMTPSDTLWGDALLAEFQRAAELMTAEPNNPEGYYLRGRCCVTAAQVVRLRFPDDPSRALRWLDEADQAYLLAYDRAFGLGAVEIQCAAAFALLHRARLMGDRGDRPFLTARALLNEVMQVLRRAVDVSGVPFSKVRVNAYIVESTLCAGTILGYKQAIPDLEGARVSLFVAEEIIRSSHRAAELWRALAHVWLDRAILEARAGELQNASEYAKRVLELPRHPDDEMLRAITQTMLTQGLAEVDRLILARYASVPDDPAGL